MFPPSLATDADVVADGRVPFRCVDRSGPPLPIS